MKRFLIAAVLFLLAGLSLSAQTIRGPKGFPGKLWDGTFALYDMDDADSQFICTAEAIGKSADGYILLSAGHCAADADTFAVSEEIGGPLTPVTVVKAYLGRRQDTVDFSLFDLKTTKKYPIMSLGPDDKMRVGDPVINIHFATGVGKQVSYGRISTQPLGLSRECVKTDNGCLGNILVQEFGTSGASGSAVVSLKTHRVIGILVTIFDAPIGVAIEPISRLQKFMAGPDQFHAAVDAAKKKDNPSLRIPEAVYQSTFGPTHPFTLTATGPNPRFTQGGYTFVANIMGMELFDDYYKFPVFIGEAEDGTFRLVETNEGYSVEVVVVQGPEQK